MPETIMNDAQTKMDKAISVFKDEIHSIRTGRATTSLVEHIEVDAYGSPQPLNQLATISTPDAATIQIQPWDAGVVPKVEKAILQANIGLTPNNDGKIIRLNIPPLTEETRKEMVRQLHHIAEESRIAIRNIRRHVNDEIKKLEKEAGVSEDEVRRMLDDVQKKTDAHVKKIDELMAEKEKEIMKV